VWTGRSQQLRPGARTATVYEVSDRLHAGRARRVRSDEIAATVSDWLAELGAQSPLVDDLARAVRAGDWAAARAVGDVLGVDVSIAA
jgi:hypothetical protein